MRDPVDRLIALFRLAPKAFWRHDVDVSLRHALAMARVGELAGVSATFYLMPRSDFYNLFGTDGQAAVQEIRARGHRLGVHTDARNGEADRLALEDLELVETVYPRMFDRKVSFHIPSPDVLWRDFAGFESAYAARWEGRYVADSRGRWDEGKEARINDESQINLHPFNWFA